MNIKSRFFTKEEKKVFQEMRINPHILKTFPTAKGSDLLICWSQASTEAFQNLRIIPQILKTPPKTPWVKFGLGWVGVNYGYWINDPHLGTFLWPPTSVYALRLHIRKSYSREKKPSTVSCVQASSHRLERPLQYFYQGCPG